MFAKEKRAEKNVHERRHEVAETGFNHVADVYRPDENEPVTTDGNTAGQAINERLTRSNVAGDLVPAVLPGEHQGKKNCRPDKAMGQDLSRRNSNQQFPVNWNQTPAGEAGDAGDESQGFLRLCRI